MLAESVETFAMKGFEAGFQVEKVAAERFVMAGGIGMGRRGGYKFLLGEWSHRRFSGK